MILDGPKKRVNILLPLDLYTQLKALSEERVYTLPGYIRHILAEHVMQNKRNSTSCKQQGQV